MSNAALVRRRLLLAACAMPFLDACAPIAARDPNAPADIALITVPAVSKLSLTIDKHPDATTSIERALLFQGDVELGINRLTEAMRGEPSAGVNCSGPEEESADLVGRELGSLLREHVPFTAQHHNAGLRHQLGLRRLVGGGLGRHQW